MYRNTGMIKCAYQHATRGLTIPRFGAHVRYLSQASTGAGLKHPGTPKLSKPALMIFGSAAIDIQSRSPTKLFPRSTTPGSIFISPGGVARNMAEAAQALLPPGSVKLVYPAAKDLLGSLLHMEMESVGLRTDGLIEPLDASATAACSLILDSNGDLTGGVSDMTIVEGLTGESATIHTEDRTSPRMLLFDCNLTTEAIETLVRMGAERDIPVFCEPTSAPKLHRALAAIRRSGTRISHLTPNTLELAMIASDLRARDEKVKSSSRSAHATAKLPAVVIDQIRHWTEDPKKRWIRDENVFENALIATVLCDTFWVKHGDKGLIRIGVGSTKEGELSLRIDDNLYLNGTFHAPMTIRSEDVVSTTGAGDTLAGSIAAELIKGTPERLAVEIAMKAVDRTLRSRRAVG